MIWVKLIFSVVAFCIGYNVVKEENFKSIVAYNIIVNIILASFDVYNRLSISIVLIYLIIVVIKSFVNSFIQIWIYRLTSGFVGYLIVTSAISVVFNVLISAFVNWIFLKLLW